MDNDVIGAILRRIKRNPKNVRFNDLLRVCDYYFGPPRQRGGVTGYTRHLGREIRESIFRMTKAWPRFIR